MASSRAIAAVVGALALGIAASQPTKAAVLNTSSNVALTATPFTVSVGGGAGSLSFTAATTGYGPGAAVSTGGNAMITTIFGSVADFGTGSSIDQAGELYTFLSYSTPTAIPFSAADDFVGFSYTLADGVHYGFAEVAGPNLVGYALQSTSNTSILTASTAPSSAVPEPASIALVLTGVAGLAAYRRRKSGEVAAS